MTDPLHTMDDKNCPACRHIMHRATGDTLMCRRKGRNATPTNAATCGQFDREPGADDEKMEWFKGAWHVSGEGRGD